jgi:hypothetical protein
MVSTTRAQIDIYFAMNKRADDAVFASLLQGMHANLPILEEIGESPA